MSAKPKHRGDRVRCPTPPTGEIREIAFTPEMLTVTVRLRNDGDRALHFIGEPRNLRYDALQKSLAIGLSDAGCEPGPTPPPHPRFDVIDPESETEIELKLPARIVRFASALSPEGFPTFEHHALSDAVSFTLEIAWADVPFYGDPRPRSADAIQTELWAQGKLILSGNIEDFESGRDS